MSERTLLEAVATQALGSGRGALIGLGMGVRYGYLDIAVIDSDCLQAHLFPALRAAAAPRRSWLLFYDSELEHECIALYSDTPAQSEPR